jgi:hypothetical protein
MVAGDPLIAMGCVIAADVIGAALMLPKSWRDPGSETLSTFALASISGVLAAGAVTSAPLLVYPVYYCLVNAALASVLWLAMRRAASAGGAVHAAPG